MGWKHIVLEGYCAFNNEKNLNMPPHCCKLFPENIGLHCLNYDEKEHKFCPYLGYGTAPSTIVLTGNDGEEVSFKVFNSDENLSNEKKWLKQEEKWIEECKNKIENLNDM